MKTLTVYFEGTANSLTRYTTQIALLSHLTVGYNLNNIIVLSSYDDYPSSHHDLGGSGSGSSSSKGCALIDSDDYHLSFDGCGVTNGLSGVIFASGLRTQCYLAIQHIQGILSLLSTASKDIPDNSINGNKNIELIVNIVGLSRGGIAVIYLTQLLHQMLSTDLHRLQINLLLFDPVPGNLIWTTKYLDLCSFTTANSAMDLSRCHHLNDILALYPYIPLPDLAFHAPLFPKYPLNCHEIMEDACLGCHQGALFCQPYPECRLSFTRMTDWLIHHGTKFVPNYRDRVRGLWATLEECVEIMDANLYNETPGAIRFGHSNPSGVIIQRNLPKSARYLNKWHKQLIQESLSASIKNRITTTADHEFLLEIIRSSV